MQIFPFFHNFAILPFFGNCNFVGNKTSCRPIQSVIKQIELPLRGRPILLSLVLQPELDDTKSFYHYYTLTSIHVVLLCSEQPKTVDDASVKLDRGKLCIESPLESVAEAMLDPG